MRAHTITTKPRVGARGRTTRTIVALGLAVALLAATASTASADRGLIPWYCPPPSTPPTTDEQVPEGCFGQFSGPGRTFDFGDRQVGTTSPAQNFALGVIDNDAFNPRISVSGDYAQTNNCPPTLSAGAYPQLQGCLIKVTFTPTGTGPNHGTLSTGPGGPTVALSGTGVTTPTPPVLPLTLSLVFRDDYLLARKLKFWATTNNDSTLVARGSKTKKTTKQLAAGDVTMIKATLKRPNRLNKKACGAYGSPECGGNAQRSKARAEIKLKATDEFGQTATDEIKFRFYKNPSL
jgi:hypothetical protein